jgi:hypothetical protein
LIRPGRDAETFALDQLRPGHYRGSFGVKDSENYHLRIVQRKGKAELQSISRGVAVGYSQEYRLGGEGKDLLTRLAEMGGGICSADPGEALTGDAQARRVQPLWPYLLGAALVLLIADVALRRVDFAVLLAAARPWRSAAQTSL